MQTRNRFMRSRRGFVGSLGTALLFAPSLLRAETLGTAKRNTSGFYTHDWRDHFDMVGVGLIISDTSTKMLQHWSSDGTMRIYPTSVPLTDELTRRGYTEVTEKRKNPSWAPTESMRARDPSLPVRVAGGAPDNPLGTRALYLSWQYYRIHGTQDRNKIGRRSSSGCIGLYNEHVEHLYDVVPVGTRVKLI